MNRMTPYTVRRSVQQKHTRYCLVPGCGAFTRNSKDYCSTHVKHHPYVRDLLALISERAAEEERVSRKGWRAVDINGSVAQEILQFLIHNGKRTLRRMAKDLSRPFHIQQYYIEALRRAGLVIITETTRGKRVVQAKLAA